MLAFGSMFIQGKYYVIIGQGNRPNGRNISENKRNKKQNKRIIEFWKDKGNERSESQAFWLTLLRDIFGINEPEKFILFEENVHIDKANGFIDGYIADTHVLIEQKGQGKDLRKPIKQSDGTFLNPFQQAKRYASELPYSQRPRWIVT